MTPWVVVLGCCIGGIVGVLLGLEQAFGLKAKAHLALCSLQIEENTRGLRYTKIGNLGEPDSM